MATISLRSRGGLPLARPAFTRLQRVRLGSIRARIYLTLAAIIVITLVIAGGVFFVLLGGYEDRLAQSTLRQISGAVYPSVVAPPETDFQAFEISRQLTGTIGSDPDVSILFVDSDGTVAGEVSPTPRFRGEQLSIALNKIGDGLDNSAEGSLSTSDGGELNYLAARLSPQAAERFGAEFMVLALPTERRQSLLGDLTPRLLLAGLLALAAALFVGLLLSRSIYLPIQRVAAAARSVARGRLDHRVEVSGAQEARELATSFNQMTEEVGRQQAALRDFLANVSHDLQTPLTSINGFSQALMDGVVDEGAGTENAYRIIEEESRRLLRLVEGLLDLSRIEAGQLSVERRAVEVQELLDHVEELFRMRAEDLNVRLEVLNTAVPDVLGDIDRLEQVLANLVDNALRHTPEGGTVVLSARPESDATVGIAVADTGVGIPEEALPALFDRYFKSDRPGAQGGTGLGLAIARELVRAQEGDVHVESREGIGTTFRVLLRAHRQEPGGAAGASGR